MTRPQHEVDAVVWLSGFGMNDCEISRATGIPRGTVRMWLRGRGPADRDRPKAQCPVCTGDVALLAAAPYCYLLGLYLGDGTISELRGKFRLRIFQDQKYVNLIAECGETIGAVRPNKVLYQQHTGCIEISAYSQHWPCLFPQHGPGRKCDRKIELAPRQVSLVRNHPRQMLRGLIHSDGSRDMNTVVRQRKDGPKSYTYPRYSFTQKSDDIREIFCWVCDLLGVHWTRMNWRTIAIARRPDVEFLDTFIGPKS